MIDASKLLSSVPSALRDPLIDEYRGLVVAYTEGRWKLSALDAGRFCEVVYTIADGALRGAFASGPEKPSRFPDACKALESRPPIGVGDRSLRVLIPRILPGMYDIRNNRNVGHVGGDVVANKMDAAYLREAATWVLAELVRVFHDVSTAEAQESVDALVERQHPLIWEHDGVKRVLAPSMRAKERLLVLLHSSSGGSALKELKAWLKYGPKFIERVVRPLSDELMIELTRDGTHAVITPLGVKRVENVIIPAFLSNR